MTDYYYKRRKLHEDDQRGPTQRDRDRILYCSHFRRLAGVTQVVAANEGHVFHSRLTHSLEVAQIARRLAEFLREGQPKLAWFHDGIDPDAVEAAGLAHDLGHPPFGHVAEQELDRLIQEDHHLFDGYEGNAQSFRIVTKLAVRKSEYLGLNLTRVTLNGILKYPWYRGLHGKAKSKWGAYGTETDDFEFARGITDDDNTGESETRSIEAEIMTWADDIAYAVHDTEDFYRAGLIPLERLAGKDTEEARKFKKSVFRRWADEGRELEEGEEALCAEEFDAFCDRLSIREPYHGTRSQRLELRVWTAASIGGAIRETAIQEDATKPLKIPWELQCRMNMVKQLTWHYVIQNPSLASQQHGYRRIVQTLFAVFMDAANSASPAWTILPPRYEEEMQQLAEKHGNAIPTELRIRTVADAISGMTDMEALRLYQRLTGVLPGSVRDPLTS